MVGVVFVLLLDFHPNKLGILSKLDFTSLDLEKGFEIASALYTHT